MCHIGDYIGGIILKKHRIIELIGEICIIGTEMDTMHVRRLEKSKKANHYHLISHNPKPASSAAIYTDLKVSLIAKIIWHRRQFK